MARKPTGRPNGRPPREFDQKTFEGLCHVWCTWEEMENILCCNRDTLDKWCNRTYGEGFREIYNKFADGGKASLRRMQLNLAKTNAGMAIWLGKQKLGQHDNIHVSASFDGKLGELLDELKSLKKGSEDERSGARKSKRDKSS